MRCARAGYRGGCRTTRSLARLAERPPDAPPARAVGDAFSPGTIAAAVWDGRRYAEELDAPPGDPDAPPFRREVVEVRGLAEA